MRRKRIFAVCASCVLSAVAASAANEPSTLSPEARQALSHLGQLLRIPADDWRIHAGDLANGESPELDDASWQVVRPKSTAGMGPMWYRHTLVVPPAVDGYEITGSRLLFQFHVEGNGAMPEIVYVNGSRVAMGEELEPIELTAHARPGDRFVIAVKVLATQDEKHFQGARIDVKPPSGRPDPEVVRDEYLSAAALLPALPGDAEARRPLLDQGLAKVDFVALARGDQAAFDRSLGQAKAALDPLRPAMQTFAVRAAGNSHIDAAWLWPWTETVDVVKRTFGTALQLMYEYPQYTYTQSAMQYNEWMEQKYPELHADLKRRVEQGRWELVGGMWVEPDLNMPDGESLARQLLVGKRYAMQTFGKDIRIGWNPDSFGYSWQLPQIYKKSGIDYFVTQKMTWNDTNKLPFKAFWWESPDGSRVLAYFPHDYVNEIDPVRIAQDVAQARALNPGADEMLHLYGVGDHGGGPTRMMLNEALRWQRPDVVFPKLEFSTAQAFFNAFEARMSPEAGPTWNYRSIAATPHPTTTVGLSKPGEPFNPSAPQTASAYTPPAPGPDGRPRLPVWRDELYFEYHRGVLTTQARQKKSNRESEVRMLNAEKFASLASLAGRPYPQAELTYAWKKVLFNQFHDLLPGSGIGVIYKEAQRDYAEVRRIAEETTAASLGALASYVDTTGAGVPVLVVNPLAWPRTDVVEADVQLPAAARDVQFHDGRGRAVLSQTLAHDPANNTFHVLLRADDVPSLGYTVYHAAAAEGAPGATTLSATPDTLENEFLRVRVDRASGCITSLFDKRANVETIAPGGCGNLLQAFVDRPKDYDAWNIDADVFDKGWNLDKADSVELTEHGPLRAVLRVTRRWQGSTFVQDVTLYAGVPRVDVINDIDWHETHILLKATFPLAASSTTATFEIPYGTIERPTTRDNSWEKAKFEVPALRWADLGDARHGFSLLNDSKYGYDAKDNVLRLTLLRSSTWPDPNADRGRHRFTYALYPHAGDWKQALTVRQGYGLNYKLIAMTVAPHAGTLPPVHSFVSVRPENVVLTAVKQAEDGDGMVLHWYEWAGRPAEVTVHLPGAVREAFETNLLEQPQGPPLGATGSDVTLTTKPYEIKAVKVRFGEGGPNVWTKPMQPDGRP